MKKLLFLIAFFPLLLAAQPTPTGNTKIRVGEGNNSWIATLDQLLAGRVGPDSAWVKYSGAYTNKRISDYVYRNAPISIGRRDTSARLYILEKTVPANNIGGALVIQGVSNGDSINYFIRLKSSAKDSTEDFLIGTINSGPISDPGDNTSWWFGQNFLPGGSKQRMSESASGWVIEDKFENSLPIVGLAASTEMHWMYSPERTPDEPDSTSDQVRVISCALDHLGRTNDLGVHADRFYINRFGDVLGYRPAKGPQWAEGDFYNKKWTWYDSLTMIYEQPQVNVPYMRFRAADNSRYWKMIESDASDRLVLNPEGNDLYTFAPNLIFNTQATVTTNDASALQIGKSALPAALAVYSSGTGVITMKNSAETTGWTHRVSATEFDIQTPGGNAPLIIHESAPQSAVYVKSDGDIGIGTGGPTARVHLYTTSGATKSMLKVENSTGVNQIFRSNATPESAITANPGDLTMASVSSTGKLYLKETGAGNTGWKEVLTTSTGPAGSGATNQVTYWTGANTVAGSANLTWDGTTHTVTGKGVYSIGNTFGANARGVDMSGTMTSSANSVSLEGLRSSVTFANSGAETGNNFRGIYTPTTTSGSTAGVHAGIWTAPTNSSTGISSFYGIFGSVSETAASGNLANRYGAFLSVDKSNNENTTHTGVGLKGRVRDQSTAGRWSTAYGLESEVTNAQNAYGAYITTSNSRGTTNTATGVRIASTVSGSGVVADNVYGIDLVHTESSSGSITNYYGIFSGSTPAATNTYGIYFPNGTWVNHINGTLGLGAGTTSPARTLHVAGEARITDLITDTPTGIVGADGDGDLGSMSLSAELAISAGTLKLAQQGATSGQVLEWNGSAWAPATDDTGGAGGDHGALSGLGDDDHPQYLLLAGRSGGQVATGGTASGDDLTLRSTTNATKGDIIIADQGGNIIIGGAATESAVRYMEPSGSGTNYTELKAGAMSSNQTYTWPTDAPSSGESLKWTSGGQLVWEPNNYQTMADGAGNVTPRARFRFVGNSEVGVTLTDDVVDQETEIQFDIPTNAIGEPEIQASAVGTSEVASNSLLAEDLAVNVVSSVDGVTNDGGNVDFVAGANMTVTPSDVSDNVTFAALANNQTTSQFTGDQDNLNPSNWSTRTTHRVSGDGTIRAITGFVDLPDGTIRRLFNNGSSALYIPAGHPDSDVGHRVAGRSDHILAPGGIIEMYYSGPDSMWQITSNTFNAANMLDAGVTGHYYTMSAGSTVAADWGALGLATASGGNGQTAPTSALPGGFDINTASSISGVATLYWSDGVTNPVEIGSAHIVTSCTVYFPTLSDGTQTYTFQFGIIPSPTSTTLAVNNSIAIRYSSGINSGKFEGFSRNNAGTESTADLGVTVAANTNYVLTVAYDKARTEARFYINGAYSGRVTGNMPNAVDVGGRAGIFKSAGTTSRSASIASYQMYTIY